MQQIRALIEKARNHEGFRRYSANTGWIFAARIATLATSFIATLYIARTLGPENYGQLSYAVSFVALFGFLASLGIDTILYRDLVRHPEKREKILSTAFVVRLITGTIAALITASVGYTLTDDVSRLAVIILSSTFVLSAFHLIQFEFQARAESKYPSIIAATTAIFLGILKIAVVALGGGVLYLAGIIVLESLLLAGAYLYTYARFRSSSLFTHSFDSVYARALILDSLPFVALSAFTIIYARIDQVFIKHLLDATSVGVYDAAIRLSDVWFFLPGILLSSLFPAIINGKTTSEEVFNRRLGHLAFLLAGIAVAVATTLSLLAPHLMQFLYGDAYAAGIPVLQIYAWSFIGASLGFLVNHYLAAENYRVILAIIAFVPMALNIVLNLMWIPQFGIVGAAYATLISYSLVPFMLFFFRPTRERIRAVFQSLTSRRSLR